MQVEVPGAAKNRPVRQVLLVWAARIILGLFVVLSILPYLLPPASLDTERRALAYGDSRFVGVEGIEVHYRLFNDDAEEKGSLLLVHGLGGSTFSWRYTAPALVREDYRIVAVDLPGFGLSERRSGLDHGAYARADLLWAFLDEYHPGRQWILVGHSMGGGVVTAMALQKPERVDGAVLVAGALAEFEPSIWSRFLRYPPVIRWFKIVGGRRLQDQNTVEQLLTSAYGRPPDSEEIAGYYDPFTVKGTDAVLADLLVSSQTPLLHRAGELRVPVLCIWGENDAWVPLERGIALNDLIPDSKLVVLPGEGHCPMETAPLDFNEALLEFLKRLD